MALQRRLVLGMLTLGFPVWFYILCKNLETSWFMPPLKHFTQGGRSGSQHSVEPPDRQSSGDPWTSPSPAATFHPKPLALRQDSHNTQAPTEHRAAENLGPKSGLWFGGADESRTEGSAPRPQRPTRPAGTTEPLFIGDTYMSEDIPPQTACPDGIRSRVMKTEFSGNFLKSIPVLQWARHVTREQYQRLSQYPGTHGWGGVDYNTLVETLSVLNSSANWQMLDDWKDRNNESECIRCAVVGNGGILNDSRKGKEIDSHHYVFRTNGVVIQGFERDVGSRTTHYTFSTNTLMNSMRSYAGAGYRGPPVSKETRYVFLPDHDRDYLLMKAAATHTLVDRGPEWGKNPSNYFGTDVSAEKLKMYHPDFVRYLRNRFLRSYTLKTKYKDIYRPSTGAVMLLAALHVCDKVSAYGFMTPDYKKYSDHYYDRSYHPVGFFINHDLRMEMVLWQRLHQAGLIRLYTRE